MKSLPINSLPPLWWLRPWNTSRRLQSHLSAVNELLYRNIQRAEEAHQQAEALRIERDRAIIQANKWRFKCEEQIASDLDAAIDEAFDDFIGDSDYLR